MDSKVKLSQILQDLKKQEKFILFDDGEGEIIFIENTYRDKERTEWGKDVTFRCKNGRLRKFNNDLIESFKWCEHSNAKGIVDAMKTMITFYQYVENDLDPEDRLESGFFQKAIAENTNIEDKFKTKAELLDELLSRGLRIDAK